MIVHGKDTIFYLFLGPGLPPTSSLRRTPRSSVAAHPHDRTSEVRGRLPACAPADRLHSGCGGLGPPGRLRNGTGQRPTPLPAASNPRSTSPVLRHKCQVTAQKDRGGHSQVPGRSTPPGSGATVTPHVSRPEEGSDQVNPRAAQRLLVTTNPRLGPRSRVTQHSASRS